MVSDTLARSGGPVKDDDQAPVCHLAAFGVVELDDDLFDDMIARVNITLPTRMLRRLDDLAAAKHQSRGAFIAGLTMTKIKDPV